MAEGAVAIIGLALAAVGAGVGAYSSVKAGDAAEDAAKASADADRANAQAAQDQAGLEAAQVRRRNVLRLGSQRAALAKSGVEISSGEDVLYDTAIQGEIEALSTLYSGNTAAGYYRSRADISRLEGRNAKTAGYLNAGATLLSGAGTAASNYANNPSFRKNGKA